MSDVIRRNKPVNITAKLKDETQKIVDAVLDEIRKETIENDDFYLPAYIVVERSNAACGEDGAPIQFTWEGEGLSRTLTFTVPDVTCDEQEANASSASGEVDGIEELLNPSKPVSYEWNYALFPSLRLISYWNLALAYKTKFQDDDLSLFFANLNKHVDLSNKILACNWAPEIGWIVSDAVFHFCISKLKAKQILWFEDDVDGRSFKDHLSLIKSEAPQRLLEIYNCAKRVAALEDDIKKTGRVWSPSQLSNLRRNILQLSEHAVALEWFLRHNKTANQWYKLGTNTQTARDVRGQKRERWIKEANRILRENGAEVKVIYSNGKLNERKTAENLFAALNARLPDLPIRSVESVRKAMSSGKIA